MTPEQLAEKSGVPIKEIEAILRGEFDFALAGEIQDEIGEQLFVFTKPKEIKAFPETGVLNKSFMHSLLQFFSYTHLPESLQGVSKPFCELAEHLDKSLPEGAEKTVALRKLLEAKDCAVRSVIFKAPEK